MLMLQCIIPKVQLLLLVAAKAGAATSKVMMLLDRPNMAAVAAAAAGAAAFPGELANVTGSVVDLSQLFFASCRFTRHPLPTSLAAFQFGNRCPSTIVREGEGARRTKSGWPPFIPLL